VSKKVLVIGSGLGGLATALRLNHRGYDVTVLEKYHQPGGRLNKLEQNGFRFDMGPSFFSMSYEFDELFNAVGSTNPLRFNELDPLYAVYFEGNDKPYLIHKDLDKLAEQFKNIEPNFRNAVEAYLKKGAAIFHASENRIVKRNFNSIPQYLLALTGVPLKHATMLLRTMWQELNLHFKSEEVKIIFSLVAFFLGATPFNTPAVYSLLNYTELKHNGYWNVQGGMYAIVEEVMKLLKSRGVKFVFDTEITGFEPNGVGVKSFQDKSGNTWKADMYVVNGDAAAFRGKVFKRDKYVEKKLDDMHWTLAPFTIYLGVKGKIEGLHHHNYFLGSNFKAYTNTIFDSTENPRKPYYYVNVSSKSDATCAPEGCENLFILCPVPDLRFKKQWDDRDDLADTIVDDLSRRVGFDIKANTLTRTVMTPLEWQQNFNLYRGSGLGLAHGLNQIGAFRPSNKDEHFNNVYYVGASTTPGTGLPMVVISSKLVTERILHDELV
jgi:phytoene desaturase